MPWSQKDGVGKFTDENHIDATQNSENKEYNNLVSTTLFAFRLSKIVCKWECAKWCTAIAYTLVHYAVACTTLLNHALQMV